MLRLPVKREDRSNDLNANDISTLLNLLHPQGGRIAAQDDDGAEEVDVRGGMSLESVQYFPHNDSARIQFSCPLPPASEGAPPHSRTRTVTCSFAEEQAKKVRIMTLLRFGIGPFSK